MLAASDIIFNATISKSENLRIALLLGIFSLLIKLPTTGLHMFRNFANFAHWLYIQYLFVKKITTFNLLNFSKTTTYYSLIF